MTFRLALRSLLAHPIRSGVLAGGFGLGVAVMAALLGIGRVILEQARAPELEGGGDVVIGGVAGRLPNAQFVLRHVIESGPLADRVAAASPSARASLYLLDGNGAVVVEARGTIPSRDRQMGDPEVAGIAAWVDTAADRAWVSPDDETLLREMDRFHPIPDVPERADSWAEWLYFNGRSGGARFYLTFLAGPRVESGLRAFGVRLQFERDGRMRSYSQSFEVTDAMLESAPDLTAGANSVRLRGTDYVIAIDLPEEAGGPRATGTLTLSATPGASLPPFTIRGSRGWVSGYTVPVISGSLSGQLRIGSDTIDLAGGAGYHDHNWGFWKGVSWQWGQVQSDALSFVYGRVVPPADAADPSRLPAFLVALGPKGPVGFASDVSIREVDDPSTGLPRSITVAGESESLSLTLDIAVEKTTTTRLGEAFFGGGMNFLQMRAIYTVSGRAGGEEVNFNAQGSAETFRVRSDRSP